VPASAVASASAVKLLFIGLPLFDRDVVETRLSRHSVAARIGGRHWSLPLRATMFVR
jgi:hypothetical protein